jgi:cilia- and flagella-associated protein 298
MVVLCVKRSPKDETSRDFDEFLVEAQGSDNVGAVTKLCFDMQNLRVRLKWMVQSAKDLAKQLDDESEGTQKAHLTNAADEAGRYLAYERTNVAKAISKMEELNQLVETLKGATMMAFPRECSGTDALQRLAAVLDGETASEKDRNIAHRVLSIIDDGAKTDDILEGPHQLWWVGKALDAEATLNKYSGKNEKTKIVVKLGKVGGNAPARESGLDHQTQSEMMAYWYRKQEEAKKLVEDDDISYANSEWANPHGLKSSLNGIGSVKTRPGFS